MTDPTTITSITPDPWASITLQYISPSGTDPREFTPQGQDRMEEERLQKENFQTAQRSGQPGALQPTTGADQALGIPGYPPPLPGESPEAYIERVTAAEEEDDDLPPFLGGFREDYRVDRPYETVDPVFGQRHTTVGGFEPRYRAGFEYQGFLSLSPEVLSEAQAQLVAAGYLDPDEISPGAWPPAAIEAMRNHVLPYANGTGKTWQAALAELVAQGGPELDGGGGRGPFITPTYVAPDYASLSQDVKRYVRSRLRRDPTDGEIAILADRMAPWHRQAWESQIAAAKMDYAAEGEGADMAEGETVPGGTVQGVDWEARYMEELDKAFQSQAEMEQREGEAADNRTLLLQAVTGLDRLVG